MFFSEISEVFKIAGQSGCSVFVLPEAVMDDFLRKNQPRSDVILLAPEDKKIITIEQVKGVLSRLSMRQVEDMFVVICPAEELGEEAANALLKSLEEPRDKVHFVLVTSAVSGLMPTILSRSVIYFLKSGGVDFDKISADEKTKTLAKRLIAARATDLPALAEEIVPKGKDGVRAAVLAVLAVAIEMLYKSYFKTGKDIFLAKVPKFIKAYENIEKNGHIKLHLVADLM